MEVTGLDAGEKFRTPNSESPEKMHLKSLIVASRAGLSVVCALVLIESWNAAAHAQWLPDRNYTEGPGIRVGDLELHPGVAVRGGYDTNIFRSEKGREVGGASIAVTPHLNIQTLSGQRLSQGEEAAGATKPMSRPVAFNLGFATSFFHTFVDNTPTNVEFDTSSGLSILPDAPVGLDVGVVFTRLIRPFTEFTGSNAENEYARDHIAPTVKLRARSHSGVLQAYVGYAPDVNIYESKTFSYLNSISHGVQAGSSWKFLPFTALVSDAQLSFINYLDPYTANTQVLISDGKTFTGRLGLNGNITPSISARALVGYAYGAYDDPELQDFENVIGEAMLGWRRAATSFEVGYQRSVVQSAIGGWTLLNRGVAKGSLMLTKFFALSAEAGAGKAKYGRLLGRRPSPSAPAPLLGIDGDTGLATDKREDVRVDASVHAEVRATNWFAVTADFAAIASLTDFEYSRGILAPPDPADFVTYQVFGGIRLHY